MQKVHSAARMRQACTDASTFELHSMLATMQDNAGMTEVYPCVSVRMASSAPGCLQYLLHVRMLCLESKTLDMHAEPRAHTLTHN